jgi:hypothetical protein
VYFGGTYAYAVAGETSAFSNHFPVYFGGTYAYAVAAS